MATTKHISDFTPQDREEILERLHAFWHIWEHDAAVDEASTFYSHDSDVNIWDGTAVRGPSWENYGPLQQPFLDELESLKNEGVGEVQILQQGDLVVTIAKLRNVGKTTEGESFDTTMRETLVWTKQDGTWRVIHEHSSPLPSNE